MSDLKPTGIKIKLGNNEYGMRFTLNVIDDIQTYFDRPINELPAIMGDSIKNIANIKIILAALINEAIDIEADETGIRAPHIDARYVGRYVTNANMHEIMSGIYTAFSDSATLKGNADPNPKSE